MLPSSQTSEVLVEVRRGDICESVHQVAAVLVDASQSIDTCFGDPKFATTLRSAAKPLQAVPLFTIGGPTSESLSEEEIAICCASHSGLPRHSALAASVLALSGYLPDNLVCGAADLPISPLKHGCSGNHAAILLIAKMLGAELEGYYLPDHPAQIHIRDTISNLSGSPDLKVAIDGCGIPNFGMSLANMAGAFASLIRPNSPWQRIPAAMGEYPELIGSEEWIDVRLMRATNGRIVAKTGAEGLLCLADRATGSAMAAKVIDGATRALAPAVIALLEQLGWLTDEELNNTLIAELACPVMRSTTGEVVGHITAHIPT